MLNYVTAWERNAKETYVWGGLDFVEGENVAYSGAEKNGGT